MKVEDLELFKIIEDGIMECVDKYAEVIRETSFDIAYNGMTVRAMAKAELRDFLRHKLSEVARLSSEYSSANDNLVKELCKYISDIELR